jgi:hypothetical protein
MSIKLSASGEIAAFYDVDQFQPAKTQFACGFFACAVVKAMTPIGTSPAQSVAQMITEAEGWYAQYNGNDSSSNLNGMTLQDLYNLIVQIGLHFQATSTDPHVLRGCYNPTTLRPGPRLYDAQRLQLLSATVVVPPWLPRPPSGFDPTQSDFVPVIPTGWRDDGVALTAPNGHRVVLGFRRYILTNAWDAANLPLQEEHGSSPLELSNPELGSGTQQIFNWTTLEWTPTRGVFVAWPGPELLALRAQIATLQAQIANLQTQLAASSTSPSPTTNQ